MGDKKRATCLATLQQNELYSDVARFTTNIKLVLHQIRLSTRFAAVLRNTLHVFFFPFFRAFTEKEKVLVRSEAFSTRSDSGEEGKMAEAGGSKGTAVLFSVYLSVSLFTKSQLLYPMPVESELLKHLTIKIYANFMNFWYFSWVSFVYPIPQKEWTLERSAFPLSI